MKWPSISDRGFPRRVLHQAAIGLDPHEDFPMAGVGHAIKKNSVFLATKKRPISHYLNGLGWDSLLEYVLILVVTSQHPGCGGRSNISTTSLCNAVFQEELRELEEFTKAEQGLLSQDATRTAEKKHSFVLKSEVFVDLGNPNPGSLT